MARITKPKKEASTGSIWGNTPLSSGSAAVFNYCVEVKRRHTHFSKYGDVYRTFRNKGFGIPEGKVLLPRAMYPLGDTDNRVSGIDTNIKIIMPPKNPDQGLACKKVDTFLKEGSTGIIVNASTGFGKTYIGCHAMSTIGKPTLILVTKSDLETQWRDSFKKFLGMTNEDIGIIKGDNYSVANKKVVIGYVQSLMKDQRYPSYIYKHFGLVILDEVHLMGADKFSDCMWQLPAKIRIGLSATIDRGDNKHHVYFDHIGRDIVKAELLPMPFDVVGVRTETVPPSWVRYSAGRTMALNKYLGSNKARQQLITSKIIKAYKKKRNCVCFADTKLHLKNAFDSLIDNGVSPRDIGYYVGGMKEEALKEGAHKPIVLTTYKMTQYGTDFPHWDTGFLMTPRADIRQITGRILREKEGKKKPLLFDFIDSAKLLESYWGTRNKWYKNNADNVLMSS
jgi:superfamily II DNA or RNA helicase